MFLSANWFLIESILKRLRLEELRPRALILWTFYTIPPPSYKVEERYTGFTVGPSLKVFRYRTLTQKPFDLGTENFPQVLLLASGSALLFSGHIGQKSKSYENCKVIWKSFPILTQKTISCSSSLVIAVVFNCVAHILPFANMNLFCGECRSRSACIFVQSCSTLSTALSLTLSQTSPGFYVFALQAFWKHCGKRRNCSWRAISSFSTLFSTHLGGLLPFSSNLKLSSANCSNLEESNIYRLAKS